VRAAQTAALMNKRLSLKIALRVNTLLSEQLGEGVNAHRMLEDALYARDVLLVCDAMADPELRKLSRMFRQALLEASEAAPARGPMSMSSVLNSIFGHHEEDEGRSADASQAHSPLAKQRRWFSRSASATK
jgi:hypothetical protein